MEWETSQKLVQLNRTFYEQFGDAFAATRQRVQPGIQRLFQTHSMEGDWLDLGCGNGAVLSAWAQAAKQGSYTGLDFSQALLLEAEQRAKEVRKRGLSVWLSQADITSLEWGKVISTLQKTDTAFPALYDGVISFATLHHIPGQHSRERVLRQIKQVLKPGGYFLLSCWQFQHSPKLLSRVQPWSLVELDPAQLDERDTLLDWRGTLPGHQPQTGLRYVHLFNLEELKELAQTCGFKVNESFESDGLGNRLGLYQVWQNLE